MRLERREDGIARVFKHGKPAVFTGNYGAALVQFHALARAIPRAERSAIFVHGLMGEGEDFPYLSAAFEALSVQTNHFRYRSHAPTWDSAAKHLAFALERLDPGSVVVGHSLGCRLIAQALRDVRCAPQKIALIAPPIKPVQWARRGARLAPVRAFLGTALSDMAGTALCEKSLAGHDLLVVEGQLPGRSGDGWLRSQETQLSAPHTRQVVQAGHTALIDHPQTCQAVIDFASL
ncbi:MAG: alpha/beta fold hydrolase [Pseudomonadota bacterium]